MALVDLKTVLGHAAANRYAVGAFNVVNLDFLEAVVKAAEAKRSPVILNIAEVHFPYVTLEHICPAIRAIAETASVPLVLNLDHGESFAGIIRAVRNGFTSIMFDGSSLTYEENVQQTADVVRICHAAGVSVEAELGAIPGVTAVSGGMIPVLAGSNWGTDVSVEGFESGPDIDSNGRFNVVWAGYFRTLGIPMLAGREFTRSDNQDGQQVAIVGNTVEGS